MTEMERTLVAEQRESRRDELKEWWLVAGGAVGLIALALIILAGTL